MWEQRGREEREIIQEKEEGIDRDTILKENMKEEKVNENENKEQKENETEEAGRVINKDAHYNTKENWFHCYAQY